MDLDRVMTRLNPAIIWILRSPLHRLLSSGLMLVTVTGRRSGRRYTIPVGYQRDGAVLTVLVSHAPRKQWWRNYRDPAPIEVHLRGRTRTGRARVVPGDAAEFREAVDATLRRLPSLGRQFGIAYERGAGLGDAQWRTVATNGALLKIVLDGRPA